MLQCPLAPLAIGTGLALVCGAPARAQCTTTVVLSEDFEGTHGALPAG